MRKTILAGLALTTVMGLPTVASAQLCAPMIIARAAVTGAYEHRELTSKEAMSCGLLIDEEATKAAAKKNKRMSKKKR